MRVFVPLLDVPLFLHMANQCVRQCKHAVLLWAFDVIHNVLLDKRKVETFGVVEVDILGGVSDTIVTLRY